MTPQEREKSYSSGQAAKKLGISVQSLKRHRLLGHIEGTRVGDTNVYTYTDTQLNAANLAPKKPGPKGAQKQGGNEGEDAAIDRWYSPIAACLTA